MDKYLEIALVKMFQVVGQEFNRELLKARDWYTTYSWTVEQEHDFEKWLAKYLYKDTNARKAICHIPRKSMRHLKKTAEMFTFQWGWPLKD